MKIPPTSTVSVSSRPLAVAGASGPAEATAPVAAARALQLSDAARPPESRDIGAPVSEARIESLRAAIAEGRYAVDGQQVADRLISWSL